MIRLVFILAIISSLFSQIAIFYGLESLSSALKMSWILPAISLILTKGQNYLSKSIRKFYFPFVLVLVYIALCDTISDSTYWGNDAINIIISFLVFAVSYVFWTKEYPPGFLKFMCLVLNVSGIILSIVVWTKYLSGYDISARSYVFEEKNSMGQIILCTMIVPLSFINKKSSTIAKTLLLVGCLWSIYIIALMKARATLVSLMFVVGYIYLYIADNKTKKWIRYGLFVGIIYLCYNSGIWDSIKNNIFLGSRETSDLNDISSGRLDIIAYAWNMFTKHAFFGVGNFYVDCFPVSLLVQFGIVGTIIIMSYLYKYYKFVYLLDRDQPIFLSAKLLLYTFLINGIFEAQPPFGPGVKCFILWVMVGFSLAQINRQPARNNVSIT